MAQDFFEQRKFVISTIDRFEGNMAVLKLEDGQTLNWPKEKLSSDASEGMEIKIFLTTAKTEEEERERTAKAVLNELLKTE
jgi:hypothetical protein